MQSYFRALQGILNHNLTPVRPWGFYSKVKISLLKTHFRLPGPVEMYLQQPTCNTITVVLSFIIYVLLLLLLIISTHIVTRWRMDPSVRTSGWFRDHPSVLWGFYALSSALTYDTGKHHLSLTLLMCLRRNMRLSLTSPALYIAAIWSHFL